MHESFKLVIRVILWNSSVTPIGFCFPLLQGVCISVEHGAPTPPPHPAPAPSDTKAKRKGTKKRGM